MGEEERLVAVVSPWEKLSELVRKKFRVESLPAEKMVAVWREDLETKEALESELKSLGVNPTEVRKQRVTTRWQDVQ